MTVPIATVDWARTYLSPSTLVVLRHDRVAVLNSSARVDITLDEPPAPAALGSADSQGSVNPSIVDLAHRLGVEEVQLLGESLARFCLNSGDPFPAQALSTDIFDEGIRVLSLADALRQLRSGQSITSILATTDDEALWTGSDPELGLVALGMFIARLPEWSGRAAYGAAFSGTAIVITGNLPPEPDLRRLIDVFNFDSPPTAFDLRTGVSTGVIDHAEDALGPAAGRLSVAEPTNTTTFGTGPNAIIHASGIAADPPSLPDPFIDKPFPLTHVSGAAVDADLAKAKAYGEAAEFFVSAGALPGHAVRAAAQDLTGSWLSPTELFSYRTDHQARLGVTDFDPDEPQWWLPGERAGEKLWLPASLVVGRTPERPSWFHPSAVSSSGVASHPDLSRAIRSAWLEAVERDAFQRTRALAGAQPPARIRPDSIPEVEREILVQLSSDADVTLLLLPSPTGLPVILVRTDTAVRLGLGGSAAHNPADALRHALIEAFGQAHATLPSIDAPELIRTPLDHASLYATGAWRSRLDWMRVGPTIHFDEIASAPVDALPATAAVYKYVPPVPLPVHVVRVLDPALIPITFGYDSDTDGRADFADLWQRSGRRLDCPLEPHPLA